MFDGKLIVNDENRITTKNQQKENIRNIRISTN
jgi:hypothetical protein